MSLWENENPYNLRFDGPHDGYALEIFLPDESTAMFFRENNRWRICGGHYCKSHVVARRFFNIMDEDGEPTITDAEWDEAVEFIETMAMTLDATLQSILEYEEREKEKEKARIEEKFQKELESYRNGTFNDEKPTYLYLMRHSNGLTKIGRSVNPKTREKTLQAEDPRLRLIFKAKDCGWLEKEIHDRFADRRKRGEWFDLTEDQVRWIKRYCYDLEEVETFQ